MGREFQGRGRRFLAASRWQNPFRIRDCRDVHECIDRFRAHLLSDVNLYSALGELEGKRLLCHCARGAPCHADVLIHEFVAKYVSAQSEVTVLVGVHYRPEEFIAKAAALEHPFDAVKLDVHLIASIRFRMTTSVAGVVAYRRQVMDFWKAEAERLQPQEEKLFKAMHPEVAGVLAGKRLCLLKAMLLSVGFPGAAELVGHMCAGFPLAGSFPVTHIFPPDHRPASCSIEDL